MLSVTMDSGLKISLYIIKLIIYRLRLVAGAWVTDTARIENILYVGNREKSLIT